VEPVPGIIRSKLVPPPVGERVLPRPRVSRLIAGLSDSNRVVLVSATSGAGKTTAVVEAAALSSRALAWLTVDASEAAAGRLLVYLEAALAKVAPSAAGVASAAMAARLSHTEAAGLLAEAVDVPVLLVVDGLEHLAADEAAPAVAALGAFLRYAPAALHVVLLSRVDVPLDVPSLTGYDEVASVGEDILAFTPEEAGAALERAGNEVADPQQVVAATGGWVMGVLFEAWRAREHVAGTGGEVDPLHGYLSSQILARLSPAEREFLTVTSLLDEVTPERAAALGQSGAAQLLVDLRSKHLPVAWTPGSYRMRFHPRFREYLMTRLERREPGDVATIRAAYAELLATEGHPEEAVDQFIATGRLDRAVAAAEVALPAVIDRLDLFVADRWLGALAGPGTPGARRLAEAELMLAITREEYHTAVRVADRIAADGFRDELARGSSRAASMMAWSYWHLARLDDARAVMAVAPPSPDLDAVHYLMALVERPAADGARVVPTLTGGPLDGLVMRVDYAHGRFREVLDVRASPWAAAISAPWTIGALRATGRLREALQLYRSAEIGNRSLAWLHGMVGPEVLIDLGAVDDARAVLARGREHIRASGSVVFDWLNLLIEAKLELRLARDVRAARAVLERLERSGARRYGFLAEALDLWSGLAALLSDDADRAGVYLRRAVESMTAADRLLDLPTVAVYLAEAEWRLGDPDAADAAADKALSASVRQGSNHQLLVALSDFPAVASRRLDAEAVGESPWQDVARSLIDTGVRVQAEGGHAVSLVEFGRVRLLVDGREVRPRIAKSTLLLAYLATRLEHEATREDLLGVLFEGRDDDSAKAYLRQAVHRLREVLPEGVGPAFVGNRLAFTGPITLRSESVTAEADLAQAGRLRGEDKRIALLQVLRTLDRTPYLPGLESTWTSQRRGELEGLAEKARLQTAQVAFVEARYAEAEALTEATLNRDPYQESAWRLLMQVGNAVGDADRVIAAFRRCREALEELGVQPSEATTSLFERLRR